MLLSDQTLHKERRKGLGTPLHSSCPPQTAIIRGSLTDTMHTIATVLLIAPLNFSTQLQETNHSTTICCI